MPMMSLPNVARVVRRAERQVCRRVWETLQEFQGSLVEEREKELIDRLEVLLRETIAYGPEEVKENPDQSAEGGQRR